MNPLRGRVDGATVFPVLTGGMRMLGGRFGPKDPGGRYLVGRAGGLAAGLGIVLLMWGDVWRGLAILVPALLISYYGLRRR